MVMVSSAWAGDFNNSFRTFVGGNNIAPTFTPDGDTNYQWYSVAYAPETTINDVLSYSNSFGLGVVSAKSTSVTFVEYRLLGKVKPFSNNLYFQAGAGLSHGFTPESIPNLATSPLYGLTTVGIGYEFDNGVELGYSWEHMSSPFHDDTGLNVGALALTFKF
jgi:hypothetical protein